MWKWNGWAASLREWRVYCDGFYVSLMMPASLHTLNIELLWLKNGDLSKWWSSYCCCCCCWNHTFENDAFNVNPSQNGGLKCVVSATGRWIHTQICIFVYCTAISQIHIQPIRMFRRQGVEFTHRLSFIFACYTARTWYSRESHISVMDVRVYPFIYINTAHKNAICMRIFIKTTILWKCWFWT